MRFKMKNEEEFEGKRDWERCNVELEWLREKY